MKRIKGYHTSKLSTRLEYLRNMSRVIEDIPEERRPAYYEDCLETNKKNEAAAFELVNAQSDLRKIYEMFCRANKTFYNMTLFVRQLEEVMDISEKVFSYEDLSTAIDFEGCKKSYSHVSGYRVELVTTDKRIMTEWNILFRDNQIG